VKTEGHAIIRYQGTLIQRGRWIILSLCIAAISGVLVFSLLRIELIESPNHDVIAAVVLASTVALLTAMAIWLTGSRYGVITGTTALRHGIWASGIALFISGLGLTMEHSVQELFIAVLGAAVTGLLLPRLALFMA